MITDSKEKAFMVTLGKRISDRRCFLDISIDSLARQSALTVDELQAIESGEMRITITDLLAIATPLDVELKDLV